MGDKILSLTTGAEIDGYLCGEKKMKLGSYLHYTQKLIWNNHRPKYKSWNNNKIPEENIGDNLYDLGLGKDFLDRIPKAQIIKENYSQVRSWWN